MLKDVRLLKDFRRLGSLQHGGDWSGKLVTPFETRADVVPIHVGDDVQRNFLGANAGAFSDAGAVSEGFGIHLRDHAEGAALALGFALR